MDQDITKLREELDNAKKEWRKAKYLHNGDKKKQSCLLHVQAAERALALYGASNSVAGEHVPDPSSIEVSSTDPPSTNAPRLDTSLSIEVKKELIEALNFGGPRDGIEGSNPENAMDVDSIFSMQELNANKQDSILGQHMDVNTHPQPVPGASAENLSMNPMSVSAVGHSSSIQQQSSKSVSNVNTTQDISSTSAVKILGSQHMGVGTSGVAILSAQAQSWDGVNELAEKALAQGASVAPSSTRYVPNIRSNTENIDMELGDSLGDSAVAQSQSTGSDSDTARLPQTESSLLYHHAQNNPAAASTNTTVDSLLKDSATVDPPLSRNWGLDSSMDASSADVLAHLSSDETSSANKSHSVKLTPAISVAPNVDDTSDQVEMEATPPTHSNVSNTTSTSTYRVIAPVFVPQPVAKTESIAQNGWTPEGQYDLNFAFPADPIAPDNSVPAIPNNLLGMELGDFHPNNDLYSHEQLWMIAEADDHIKNDDVEVIAPYLVAPESQMQSHRSDTDAIRAFSTELNNKIAQLPNVLVYGQYTFKIDDINWDTLFPAYTRMASDSDQEHRLRSESYKAKAAWMFISAYEGWMENQMQTLKEQATKGIADFAVFMTTWNKCEADKKELSRRTEEAKKRMEVAQKEMDTCFKGKSRAVLEYSIEELQARILSDDDISRDDLHLLRAKLMTQKNALREIISEEDVQGSEDESDSERQAKKNAKKRGGDSDASSIPYLKMSEEKQTNLEKKARITFHRFARFAASAVQSSDTFKTLAKGFKVSYRRTVRAIRGFLPEAATTSRSSALLCLTTGTPNSFCLGHHRRHAAKRHDSVTHFRGVAYPKNATARGCGLSNPKYPEPNHLHCGCLIDDALLEFYFFKTVTARSSHPLLSGVVHYMDDAFTPFIIRSFWMSQFRNTTGLTMDDIYNLNADEAVHQVAFTARMIEKHVDRMRNNRNIGVSLQFDSPKDKAAFFGTTSASEEPEDDTELNDDAELNNDAELDDESEDSESDME